MRKNIEIRMGSLSIFNVSQVCRSLAKKGGQELATYGFTLQFDQLPVLLTVGFLIDSCLSQQDIANLLQRDKSGIQRSIHILVRDGYLQILPAISDKRKNVVQMTPTGRIAFDKIMVLFQKIEEDLIRQLDTEEIATFIKTIAKLTQLLRGN